MFHAVDYCSSPNVIGERVCGTCNACAFQLETLRNLGYATQSRT